MHKLLLKMILSISLLVFSAMLYAEVDYEFKSNLLFKHEQSLLPGELESYSLNENAEVKMIIGLLENRPFWDEANHLSEVEIRDTFLDKDRLLDPINGQSDRTVSGFKKEFKDGKIIIQISYLLKKYDEKWIETNTYVMNSTSTAFASLQYPNSISNSNKNELQKGIENFKLIESNKKSVWNKVKDKFSSLITFYNPEKLLAPIEEIGYLLVDKAWAENSSEKFKSCYKKEFIITGEFTTKPGSALFNFSKISKEIKDESIKMSMYQEDNKKSKADDSKLICLSNYYKEAKANAKKYWVERASREECIVDGKEATSESTTCSDSTKKEMKKSLAYLDNIDRELQTFVSGNVTEKVSCLATVANNEELDQFKKLNASVQQSFCCASGDNDNHDKGPLYQLVESEDDNFKNYSPAVKAELCLKKTSTDPKKNFLSADGLGECAQSFFEGLGKLLKDTIKTVSSLFDLATLKALGQFVADLPSSGKQLIQVIGEQIAAQLYSVTDCMSPYESKQYICKMVPSVAATLMGPGLIKSFAKSLVDKTSKTALAQLVAKAASENKQFQKMKAIAATVGASSSRISKTILKSRFVKPSAAILGKISSILGKDISTPLKEMVIAGVAKLKEAPGKMKTAAQSVLKKPSIVLAEEVTDEAALAAAKKVMNRAKTETVSETVQGADGVYREVKLSSSTDLVVPSREIVPVNGLKTYTPTQIEMISDSSKFREAVSAGRDAEAQLIKERMLGRASKLTDEDRIKLTESLTRDGSPLSLDQRKLIIEAHEVGLSEGRGFGTYTNQDIAEKTRLLERAGITDPKERRLLMESGITGTDTRQFFRETFDNHYKKVLGKTALSETQSNALLAIHDPKPLLDSAKKVVTPKEYLVGAGFSEKEAESILTAQKAEKARAQAGKPFVEPKAPVVALPVQAPVATSTKPITPPAPIPEVISPGRKAVLSNYTRDDLYNYKFMEIPDGLKGEDLATKQRARAAHAKSALDKISGKDVNVQAVIYDNGEMISKSKKSIAEAEEKLAKLPAKGSDLTRKELNDKLERSKASLEVGQKRCRAIIDLYKVGYGIEQYVSQYERDFKNHCL